MRWIIFFILASVAVAFSDDQLLQQAIKNNTLMASGKLDVVRFINYSSRTQLKLNGKVSTSHFTNLSSSSQAKLNNKVDKTITVNGQALSSNVTITTITGNAGTATALAANGTNCSAGQAPLGVDASGNAEGCYAVLNQNTSGTAASLSAVLSSSLGGAGSVSGLLKANGSGTVSSATANSDYAIPAAWTTPTFAAGTYYGGGSMTWTVASGSVSTFEYTINGHVMTVNFFIDSTTVGGTLNTYIAFTIPGGKTATKALIVPIEYLDNGTEGKGVARILAGATEIRLYKTFGSTTNWTASTSNTGVYGSVTFEIN